MEKKIIIAIDGYSSCGKSTFAKAIAAKLGYTFIDSGAMYRAVTLASMKKGFLVPKSDIIALLDTINLEFRFNSERGASDIYLNGECVESQIRTLEVSQNVSKVSSITEVRRFLVDAQQKMGINKALVMDGRDIGTTVFPDAELKIFMTASTQVRAMRRFEELKSKNQDTSFEDVMRNILERDFLDENREESPLRRAKDSYLLDNSKMTVEQQMEWVDALLSERL